MNSHHNYITFWQAVYEQLIIMLKLINLIGAEESYSWPNRSVQKKKWYTVPSTIK